MSKIIRRIINSSKAAKVKEAPYNQAVSLNDTLYISGVLGLNNDMKLVEGGASSEARQALINLGHILEEAGCSYENVVKNTIFLSDINDYGAINDVYKQFFKKDFPARSAFQVAKLPLNARLEIESIAAIGKMETVGSKL